MSLPQTPEVHNVLILFLMQIHHSAVSSGTYLSETSYIKEVMGVGRKNNQ